MYYITEQLIMIIPKIIIKNTSSEKAWRYVVVYTYPRLTKPDIRLEEIENKLNTSKGSKHIGALPESTYVGETSMGSRGHIWIKDKATFLYGVNNRL